MDEVLSAPMSHSEFKLSRTIGAPFPKLDIQIQSTHEKSRIVLPFRPLLFILLSENEEPDPGN